MDIMLGHLISFRSDSDPKMYFWDKDEVSELELLGKELSIKFSDYILCTGHQTYRKKDSFCGPLKQGFNWTLDTRHKCPHGFKGKKQCGYCRHKDISKIYTRLDFGGYEELQEEYVHQEFSIYLAGFGSELIKCGVTKSERVEARLKEQGADYWVELMRFDNGEEAYAAEIELQNRFGLKNFIRNDVKLRLLGKARSPDALKSKLEQIKRNKDFAGRSCNLEIRENVFPVPEKFEPAYSIDGKITCAKGQLLFFEKDSSHFVLPMYNAIGRVFLLKE